MSEITNLGPYLVDGGWEMRGMDRERPPRGRGVERGELHITRGVV